ncbi:MAG: SDR family NAD(P)-dependent oxidoreductase, partial [Planctomycetota bacterium]
YGPIFRMLSRLGSAPSEAIGFVNCDDSVTSSIDDYCWHPVLGDAIFQSFSGLVPREADGGFSPQTYMPTSIKRFRLLRPIDANTIADGLRVYGVRTSPGDVISPETVTGDLWVIDAADQVVAFAQQVTCSRLGRLRRSAEETLSDAIYDVAWQPLDQLANRNGSLGTVGVLTSPHQTNDVEPIRLVLAQSGVEVRTVDESDLSAIDDLDLILDARAIGPIDDDAVATTAMDRCESLLTLLQSLTRRVAAPRGGVVVLTQDAQSVLATDRLSGFSASPLASMVRVAQSEMPDVPIRVIDLPCDWESSTVRLADALSAPKSEFQLAIRASDVYAARLHSKQNNAPESASSDPDSTGGRTLSIPASSYRLRFTDAGQLDSLHYEAHELPDPDSDQVQLKIHAAGLNFSDVLKVMGLYPGITDPVVPLGIECSGVVTKVGPEVTRFKEGDEVLGVAPFAFASHANTPAYTLVHRPTLMGVTEAASIPIAFLTAWHGLVRLADTQPGERVLIHAGAGGVGLAAIQIAKMLGAEVFATAGSPSKRDFITSMGADHVFDSRSLAFADEIQRQTKGEGIDVVLNSLPGEAIPKSLSCLRAYGRFLEIGKTDIYQNRSIGMLPFQDNLSFHAIDLDRVLRQRPKTIESLYREVMAKFESGELEPTHHKIFEAINVIDAFRYMSARKNIGKVLVQMAAPGATAGEVTSEGVDDAIGTALITGGTGAIGLKLANDLIDRGHTHVALLSRRGIDPTPAIPGGRVCVLKGDVADPDSLDSALGRLPEDFPAITDVYHAAGVLDDGSMMEMTSTKLRKPMSSKIQGTWNLHSWSRKRDLRRFVLFSSIASTLGSPGQSNYAAANGFMDALARHRRVQGLPATSIAWGPWADAGMATGDAQDANLKSRGLSSLSPDQSFELMHELINNDVANVAVVKADWGKLLSLSPKVPYFELIAKQSQNGDQTIAADLAFLDQLSGMDDVSHRQAVEGYFSNELARLMGWDVKQIDQTQPLGDIGMDSLIAMEFKLNLEKLLQVSIPMAALAESPSIESLVGSIWESLPRKSSDGNATQSSDDGYRSLMMLREGEEGGPTWVLVHPLGGSVACYETLVGKAPKSVRCIGVIGRGADGSLDPHADLDAMMDEYVSELVAADLPNDLQLIGWSAGGLFALELMRRLQQTDWSQSRTLTLSLI